MKYVLTEAMREAIHSSDLPKYQLAAKGGLQATQMSLYLGGQPFGRTVRLRFAKVGEYLSIPEDAQVEVFNDPIDK